MELALKTICGRNKKDPFEEEIKFEQKVERARCRLDFLDFEHKNTGAITISNIMPQGDIESYLTALSQIGYFGWIDYESTSRISPKGGVGTGGGRSFIKYRKKTPLFDVAQLAKSFLSTEEGPYLLTDLTFANISELEDYLPGYKIEIDIPCTDNIRNNRFNVQIRAPFWRSSEAEQDRESRRSAHA